MSGPESGHDCLICAGFTTVLYVPNVPDWLVCAEFTRGKVEEGDAHAKQVEDASG